MELTLGQTIERARRQSPDAQTAQHSFRSAYWNYKYYRANYLPALKLTSDPYLNRAINKITMSDGSVKLNTVWPDTVTTSWVTKITDQQCLPYLFTCVTTS